MRLASTALAVLFPCLVSAECLPRNDMVRLVEGQFQEVPQFMALTMGGSIIEVYANLDTGAWTAVETLPDGTACIVSFGDNFEPIPQGLEG